jgi:class 3 adenylate cyclase
LPETERRLAAILAADVAGFSGLVEVDEAASLVRLRGLREAVIEPALRRHRGRLVKLMGDGLLAEFPSVVDAAACALAIQDANAAHEAGRADALRLRIGVNLGDVVIDGDDLLGDGVNIAARLEGLAEPGGVVVSGTVYDHLHGKLGLRFASLELSRFRDLVVLAWPPLSCPPRRLPRATGGSGRGAALRRAGAGGQSRLLGHGLGRDRAVPRRDGPAAAPGRAARGGPAALG